MGAVVAPLPEPPAEQVTETKLGEHLKRNGCGALGCCLLKNLVDAHIVLL